MVSRRLEGITELSGADRQHPERALEIQLAPRLYRTRRNSAGAAGLAPAVPSGSPKEPPARERDW
ncbi:hypothetical protein [Streptomyces sp. GESEQ-13]|uniref:hypothetical protein n=1 Tax=Streptomyces sp. GESEQ-13 TaxID=2812654 RepID=UPI001B33C8FD